MAAAVKFVAWSGGEAGGDVALYLGPLPPTADDVVWRVGLEGGGAGAVTQAAALVAGGNQEGELTLEEELRRERLRQATTGITAYQVVGEGDGARLLYSQGGSWYAARVGAGGSGSAAAGAHGVLLRESVALATGGNPEAPLLDAKPCPAAGSSRWVAVVHDGEVLLACLPGDDDGGGGEATVYQVTEGARGNPLVRHGLAEYIAEEELDRHDGFWWSPDGRYLLYQRTDESGVAEYVIEGGVPVVRRGHHAAADGIPLAAAAAAVRCKPYAERWRYPFAGAANAAVSLHVLDVGALMGAGDEGTRAAAAAALRAATPHHPRLDTGPLDAGYVARVQWLPSTHHAAPTVFVQLLDRAQATLDLVRGVVVGGHFIHHSHPRFSPPIPTRAGGVRGGLSPARAAWLPGAAGARCRRLAECA